MIDEEMRQNSTSKKDTNLLLKKTHKLKSLKHLIQSMSRKAYWDYVEDLIMPKDEHSLEEKFSVSKKFYTFIKHKKTDSTGIKTLKKNGVTVTDPENKADPLNNHFHSVFSQQIPMKLSALCAYFSNFFQNNQNDMPEIHVTENGVNKTSEDPKHFQSCWPRWYQTKSAKRIILRISTYPYSAFQGISASTISFRHLETCQC